MLTFLVYKFKFRYYINGTQPSYDLRAPTPSSEEERAGYERLFFQPYCWSLETTSRAAT
jgi:hypothetical protein